MRKKKKQLTVYEKEVLEKLKQEERAFYRSLGIRPGRVPILHESFLPKHLRASFDAWILVEALERAPDAGGCIDWERLEEGSVSRIWAHIKSGNAWAILTPWKGELSNNENRKRLHAFFTDLRKYQFGAIPMRGAGQEAGGKVSYEMSFFIPKPVDMDDKTFHNIIRRLAKKYEQWGYVIYAPAEDEYIRLYGNGPGNYQLIDKWDYVSFTFSEFVKVGNAIYYSQKRGVPFQFQSMAQRQAMGLPVDPRAKVKKPPSVYEGFVRHCFSFLEGLAVPEKSIRHARYAYIVRPFFTAGGIEPEEI